MSINTFNQQNLSNTIIPIVPPLQDNQSVILKGVSLKSTSNPIPVSKPKFDMSQIKPGTYINITGKVVSVNNKRRDIFKVYTHGIDATFTLNSNAIFCPVQEGDAIQAYCRAVIFRNKLQLNMTRQPFVQIAVDMQSIKRYFIKILRRTGFGEGKATRLYDIIAEISGGRDNVASWLTVKSALYSKMNDADILTPLLTVLREKQASTLLYKWYKQRSLRRLYLFGLTNRDIDDAKMSADEIYERCVTNPYTVVSLSMEKCNNIFTAIKIKPTNVQTKCGIVARKIYDNMKNRAWIGTSSQALFNEFKYLPKIIHVLREEYGIDGDFRTLYLPFPYKVETVLGEKIIELVNRTKKISSYNIIDPNYVCTTLTDEQKAAIKGALNNHFSVITGGAGTGKTTVIRSIIHNLELLEISYMVCSFTGKAVARIREVVNKRSPSTMHRLISRSSEVPTFKHLIIDEASMVTSELFYEFIEKFGTDYKITLIGDPNQLCPISWGSLFEQIIISKTVPNFFLSHNHRSDLNMDKTQNGILINSKGIVDYANGVYVPTITTQVVDPNQDLYEEYGDPYDECDDFENCQSQAVFKFTQTNNFNLLEGKIEIIYDLVRQLNTAGVPSDDVTIVTPFNVDKDELNAQCQQIYNGDKHSIVDSKGHCWCLDDKIICNTNLYSINIMNGETGKITHIGEEEIEIEFYNGSKHDFTLKYEEGNSYVKNETDKLKISSISLAYAITIHKSQGSENKFVIVYIPERKIGIKFLNRNLIYTGITRAKNAVWIVGSMTTSNLAAVTKPAFRVDNLSARLLLNKEKLDREEETGKEVRHEVRHGGKKKQ